VVGVAHAHDVVLDPGGYAQRLELRRAAVPAVVAWDLVGSAVLVRTLEVLY
jgi:hypothetical protein